MKITLHIVASARKEREEAKEPLRSCRKVEEKRGAGCRFAGAPLNEQQGAEQTKETSVGVLWNYQGSGAMEEPCEGNKHLPFTP